MKRIALWGVIFLMAGAALAEETAGGPPNGGRKEGPCREIVEACKNAGFVKGKAKEGKGLFKNCVEPILAGQSVQGVSVDAGLVQACQERRAKRKERKAGGDGDEGQGGHEN